MSRVLVEFTKDTKDADGNVVRTAGSRLYCDEGSAKSFAKKGVAKAVTGKALEKAEAEAGKAPEPLGPVGVPPGAGPDATVSEA